MKVYGVLFEVASLLAQDKVFLANLYRKLYSKYIILGKNKIKIKRNERRFNNTTTKRSKVKVAK